MSDKSEDQPDRDPSDPPPRERDPSVGPSGERDPSDPPSGERSGKRRWLIALAVVLLGLAVLGVGAALRSDRQSQGEAAGDAADPSAAPSDPAGSNTAPSPSGATPDTDGEQQDQRTAQVCDQILALQDNLQSGGIDPLNVVAELTEIERRARGTHLADQADAAMSTLQDFLTGQATTAEVVAAGNDLASAC